MIFILLSISVFQNKTNQVQGWSNSERNVHVILPTRLTKNGNTYQRLSLQIPYVINTSLYLDEFCHYVERRYKEVYHGRDPREHDPVVSSNKLCSGAKR